MKTIYLFILLSLPVIANAENYFRNGMEWVTRVISTSSAEHPTYIWNDTLEGDTIVDGFNATKLIHEDDGFPGERQFMAFIRIEGEKVFFRYDLPDQEWYLWYDFGLKEGEECNLYHISFFPQNDDHTPNKVKCLKIEESQDYPGLTAMTMVNVFEDYEPLPDEYGTWFKGLGSSEGVLMNDMFHPDGGGLKLLEAFFDGRKIFEDISLSVDEIPSTDSFISIFSIDGRMIYKGNIEKNRLSALVPIAGIYIVKTPTETRKVLIR